MQPGVSNRSESKPELENMSQKSSPDTHKCSRSLPVCLTTSHLVKIAHTFCAAGSSQYVLSTQSNVNTSVLLPCSQARGKFFFTCCSHFAVDRQALCIKEDSALLAWQTQFGALHLHFVVLQEDSLFPSSTFYKLNHNVP